MILGDYLRGVLTNEKGKDEESEDTKRMKEGKTVRNYQERRKWWFLFKK